MLVGGSSDMNLKVLSSKDDDAADSNGKVDSENQCKLLLKKISKMEDFMKSSDISNKKQVIL